MSADAVLAFLNRRREVLVPVALLGFALLVYLPYALKAGWYYDDWRLSSDFQAAGSSWSAQFHQCAATIPAGRSISCLYLVTEYHLFTAHRSLYALLSLAFLVAMAWMTYLVLCRCRLAWPWAALAAVLLVAFPASDSTRLWEAASYGQYVIVLELAGVLLALRALRLERGWARWAMHGLSLLLMLAAMVTYEIALPLVALNGFVYWAAYRNRQALRRGLVDLGLAIAFVFYRLVLNPPGKSEGFVEHRTIGGNVSRAWTLIESAWETWHATFLPGTLAAIVVAALLAVALVLAIVDTEVRRRLRFWAAFLVAALVVAGAATLVFQTANDLYRPEVGSLFNRVVLPASIAYVCVFIALLGIGFELVRRYTSRTWAALLLVVAVVLASGWHQLRISSTHKEHWEAAWAEQKKALPGYEAAVRGLPVHSRIVGFGAPTWVPEFIPIFAAPWDLKGALSYETDLRPRQASPMISTSTEPCRPQGVVPEGTGTFPYEAPGEPLYFIDATSGTAIQIRSEADCKRVVARWGVPPFWAIQ
ncbi:MAG TPA: hypothetical protein VGG40_09515 [Solirubrobacterales bacterium]